MKKILKIVLTIWLFLLVFFHLIFILSSVKTIGLILIVLWWVISILIVLYYFKDEVKDTIKMDKQNKLEKSKKYREQFVTSINIENDFFGPLVFEKNTKKNTIELVSKINNISFKNEKIECSDIVISINSEDKINIILETLEKNIRNADAIMDKYYKAVQDIYCGDAFDKDGKPIDESNVTNHCRISYVTADEDYIIFFGFVDDIYESDGSPWNYDTDLDIRISINDNKIEIV